MAMDGIIALALAKKYTKDTADGLGAVTGAPCTIKNTVKTDDGNIVTFEWTGTSGATETSQITIEDGADGVSVAGMVIDGNNHLICTMTDGSTIDAGEMPTISSDVETFIEQKIDEKLEDAVADEVATQYAQNSDIDNLWI
jgi:hypothetical protein